MWEDANRKQPPQPGAAAGGRAKKDRRRRAADLVLWVQILLCLAALGAAVAAKHLQWPVYRPLRTAFYRALEAPGLPLLDSERRLARFTQQTAAELQQAARQVLAQLQGASTAETARTAHRTAQPQKAAPSGSSLESYLPPFALHFPLPGSHAGETSGYGWRIDPVGGEDEEFHTGADLPAAEGTPVYAAAGGVVRAAGAHNSYGNYLRILHQNGDETLYAHLQYLYVRPGQRVGAGQVIGASGQTGNVTGPHLHFELLHGGVRYDPTQALQQAAV